MGETELEMWWSTRCSPSACRRELLALSVEVHMMGRDCRYPLPDDGSRVEVCTIKEGDEVCWICPNDPEFSPLVTTGDEPDEATHEDENDPPVMTVTISGVTYSCASRPRKRSADDNTCPAAPHKRQRPLTRL